MARFASPINALRMAAVSATACIGMLAAVSGSAQTALSVVKVEKKGNGFQLVRNGDAYFVKGAGGDGPLELLRACGGNSVRTWGVDKLGTVLDAAQKQGLTVTAGIWLGHKEHGFDYNNANQVAEQYEKAREAIQKYRNHPALLMWAIGNEMEVSAGADNAAVWSAVNNIATASHALDPNHPTMTVIAELGGNKVRNIHRLCPDIDIVGINSYGGGPNVAQRYVHAGGAKPYLVTEYGPPGIWEIGKNSWGAYSELTSTEKAEAYRKTYEGAIAGQPLCLGGYAFTWGNKQEATATWFGLLLPDGARLGAVDALTEAWTGKPAANRCPLISSLKVDGSDQVGPAGKVSVKLAVSDPEGDPLQVKWVLQGDPANYHTNGDTDSAPPTFPDAIGHSDATGAEVVAPKAAGIYRLFAYVRDGHGGAAVANVPLLVKNASSPQAATLSVVKLPFKVYDEVDRGEASYVPSGYMGNAAAIKMNERCPDNPHSGKTCLKVNYAASDNWGGVVWQSPANDWGEKPGGMNLSGAKRLTFWARGEKGGETVSFLCGLLTKDKPFYDTVQEKLDRVTLTKEWKQYSIDLRGKDLSRIKTGFAWTYAATGSPATFFLDDIQYE